MRHCMANLLGTTRTKFCQNQPGFVEDVTKHLGFFGLQCRYLYLVSWIGYFSVLLRRRHHERYYDFMTGWRRRGSGGPPSPFSLSLLSPFPFSPFPIFLPSYILLLSFLTPPSFALPKHSKGVWGAL